MVLQVPKEPFYFVVDAATERNTGWHDGAMVYVKDDDKLYILEKPSTWVEIGA